MNYTLHQLQVYLKVVQTKSITVASRELYLTQPAISIQIKNFQDQFEIPLIEVIGRKVYITEFGKEIAEVAERIINDVNAINYKALAFKNVLSGILKIAIVSTGKYIMPYYLTNFLNSHTGIDLKMDVTNKYGVLKSLENNEVDFALVSVLPDVLKVNEEILLENKLYLVGNAKTDLQSTLNDQSIFERIPLIYREEGSGTRLVMESFFEKSKINTVKKLVLTSNEAVKQAVIAGLGYSVMPLIGVHKEIKNKDLQIIPVSGFPIKSSWRLIWLQKKQLSPVANAFLSNIRIEKHKILESHFSWINVE